MVHRSNGWALAAALLAAVALAACGGGGSGNGGGDSQRFTLSVSVAGSGQVRSQPSGIDCGTTCRVAFDADLSVTLTAEPAADQRFSGWGGACSGTSVSCTLTMAEARTVSAQFLSLPPPTGGWGDPARLSGAGVADAVVAIDAAGRATTVWRQREPGTAEHHLWASRSASGGGWSAPERVENNPGDVTALRLAVDRASGRGMLVWVQVGSTVDLRARALDPGTGWGPSTLVETGAGVVGVASVGVDANGDAVAVWSQIGSPGRSFSIFANRYLRASGWATAELIETNEVVGSVDGDPIVAVMPTGDAVTVWKRSIGSAADLWTNRYAAAGSAWGTASQVVADAGTAQFNGRHDLAADAQGRALLVWGQGDIVGGAFDNAIWFKRFSSSGWQADATRVAPPVANTQGFISTPVLKLNEAGAAVVGWVQFDRSLSAATAPAGGLFGVPATLRPAATNSWTALPALGIDDAGGALAAWADPDSQDLVISRLTPGSAWTAASAIESYVDPSFGPTLAMSETGNAVLAWPQLFPSSGTELVARRYTSSR